MTKLNCGNCPHQDKIRNGMSYWESPCSVCRLSGREGELRHEVITDRRYSEYMSGFLRRVMLVTRHEDRRRILFLIVRQPRIRDREMAELLELKRRKVSYHARIIRNLLPELFGASYRALY